MGKLEGKVAIVTGGSRGQGAAHVRLMVEEGAKVVFTDILVDEGEALAKELGESVKFIKQDVSKEDEWKHVVAETEAAYGPINILVNNAGIVMSKFIEDTTEEDFRRVIDINLLSQFFGMKAVLPSMKKTGNGSIINVSSVNGLVGGLGSVAYAASKFGGRGMTKTAALELAQYGIRVNSVHPGVIETPMLASSDPELNKQYAEGTPLGRMGRPDEIAKLILFLASDDASYSTGSEFVIDGGITAS